MLSRISAAADSVEMTWTGATSSTHYRFQVRAASLRGKAWHHSDVESATVEPRDVTAFPVRCLNQTEAAAYRSGAPEL